MVHIILVSILLAAFFLKDQNRYVQAIPFIALFLFAGLRYQYGNDYGNYAGMYALVQAWGPTALGYDYLYGLLSWVCPSFYILIAVTSAVFVYVVYRLVSTSLPVAFIWMGLFVFVINPYLFLMNLSAIRQCLAMVLFIVAVPYAINRKPVHFFALVVLATLFHKSAIILLPVYFIATPKEVYRRGVALYVAVVAGALVFVDFSSLAMTLNELLFSDGSYSAYIEGGMTNSFRATVLTGLFFVYVAFNLPRLSGSALVYAKLCLIGFTFGVLAYEMSSLTRLQMYFDIFGVVALPLIFLKVWSEGPVFVREGVPLRDLWRLVNRYVLPTLLVIVYLLRYYSFFTNPMWESFASYSTVLTLL